MISLLHRFAACKAFTRRIRSAISAGGFAALVVTLMATPPITAQTTPDRSARQMWNDPEFVKNFLGSYGFLAGFEPEISEQERTILRGLIDTMRDNPAGAIRQLEPQLRSDSSAALDFILANLHFQEGNLPQAERSYQAAIRKYPNFRRAYKNLGLLQVQRGDFEAATKTISKTLELGDVDGRAYGLLGYSYLTLGRHYPAEAAYRQAILLQPDVKDWKLGLARSLLLTERYRDAIALFDTLLQDEPDNADYWLLQSNAYLGAEQSMAAAKNLEIVRRMGRADLRTLTLLGDIYMNHQAPDLALDAYLAAIDQADQDDARALVRAAELLTRSGNHEQATAFITQTRQKFADRIEGSVDLRLLTLEARIARAAGDDATAVTALNQIIERDALNGEALIELGNYYADQGDLPRAINRFEQAEKIDAYQRDALIAHAQALVRHGRLNPALPLLRRALNIRSETHLEDYTQRVERAARRSKD